MITCIAGVSTYIINLGDVWKASLLSRGPALCAHLGTGQATVT